MAMLNNQRVNVGKYSSTMEHLGYIFITLTVKKWCNDRPKPRLQGKAMWLNKERKKSLFAPTIPQKSLIWERISGTIRRIFMAISMKGPHKNSVGEPQNYSFWSTRTHSKVHAHKPLRESHKDLSKIFFARFSSRIYLVKRILARNSQNLRTTTSANLYHYWVDVQEWDISTEKSSSWDFLRKLTLEKDLAHHSIALSHFTQQCPGIEVQGSEKTGLAVLLPLGNLLFSMCRQPHACHVLSNAQDPLLPRNHVPNIQRLRIDSTYFHMPQSHGAQRFSLCDDFRSSLWSSWPWPVVWIP